MKVTPEHFQQLKEAIEPLDTPEVREAYRNRQIPRAEAVKDIDKRYRWDLYFAAVGRVEGLSDAMGSYYASHIDTALRKIVKPLGSTVFERPPGNVYEIPEGFQD